MIVNGILGGLVGVTGTNNQLDLPRWRDYDYIVSTPRSLLKEFIEVELLLKTCKNAFSQPDAQW